MAITKSMKKIVFLSLFLLFNYSLASDVPTTTFSDLSQSSSVGALNRALLDICMNKAEIRNPTIYGKLSIIDSQGNTTITLDSDLKSIVVNGYNVLTSSNSYARTNAKNTFTYEQTISSNVIVGGNVVISSGKKLNLDGLWNGDTHVREYSANNVYYTVGSNLIMNMTSGGVYLPTTIPLYIGPSCYLYDTATPSLRIKVNNVDQFELYNGTSIYLICAGGSSSGLAALYYNTSSKQMLYDTSAERFKTNIKPMRNGSIDKIMKLKPSVYDRKDGSVKNEEGLIAEEVEKVFPESICRDEKGNIVTYGKNEIQINLIKAFQEYKLETDKRIKALENKLK